MGELRSDGYEYLGVGEVRPEGYEWRELATDDGTWMPGHREFVGHVLTEHHLVGTEYRVRRATPAATEPGHAPASAWVRAEERQPPIGQWVSVRGYGMAVWNRAYADRVLPDGCEWLDVAAVAAIADERDAALSEVDRLRAEIAEVERMRKKLGNAEERMASLRSGNKEFHAAMLKAEGERDAALAEVGRLKTKIENIVHNFTQMLCQDCTQHTGDRCPSPTAIMDALKGRCHLCDAAEVERLRGELARVRRDADHVGELRRRIAAAGAALEGRDG